MGSPRLARSFDLHQHLTLLFVCAVSTVLLTRSFLAATGYPQVGGSKLHIAHVLWGGLLLLASLVACLAFLSPFTKALAAVAGGIGFGLFIDEVGKFVTKDVDYFYRPAIAIIYVCFVLFFAVIRFLSRRRFSSGEALLIGLETLQRAAVGGLSDERRSRVLALLEGERAGLAGEVRALLERTSSQPAHAPSRRQQFVRRVGDLWEPFTQHRAFRSAIFTVLVVAASISAAETAWLLRDGISHLPFSVKAFALTTAVADLALVVGAVRLSRSLLSALHWYEHAVLLEITVAQVFLYSSEQLVATLDLFALLLIWAMLRWAIHYESARPARRGA